VVLGVVKVTREAGRWHLNLSVGQDIVYAGGKARHSVCHNREWGEWDSWPGIVDSLDGTVDEVFSRPQNQQICGGWEIWRLLTNHSMESGTSN